MKNMKNMKIGFTIAEILIIVSIIGLLSAIAIPAFLKAKEAVALKEQQSLNKNIELEKPDKDSPKRVAMTEAELLEKYELIQRRKKIEMEKLYEKNKTENAVEFRNKINDDKIRERVEHDVTRVFEIDGIVFYSSTVRNNFIMIAISSNGVVSISK
jgi:Tfp pilus assembly protein PilE